MKAKDKELTKARLIGAVEAILTEAGYRELGINKVAKKAGVDKQLIYRYFGDLNGLIEEFLISRDYWTGTVRKIHDAVNEDMVIDTNDLVDFFLERQFYSIYDSKIIQEIILWSISEPNLVMKKLSIAKKELGRELFKRTDKRFKDSTVDFRAISAITAAGIYFLVLHLKTTNETFCEIDINTEAGKERILNAVRQINRWAFEAAGK